MIRKIIFDWGGVLCKGDADTGTFTGVVVRNASGEKADADSRVFRVFDRLIAEMDLGRISSGEFTRKVEEELGLGISEPGMGEIFRKSIVPNDEVIRIAEKLAGKYDLVMASNNNEVVMGCLEKEHAKMLGLFQKGYFSHELGMGKPNPQFFEYLLKDLKVSGSECIFIDDKQENLDVASEKGMKTILYTDAESLKKGLSSYGISPD